MISEDRYDSLIRYYAESNSFDKSDWLLFKAQIKQESMFNPYAISNIGAIGLAQFMPGTWHEWNRTGDPRNPEESIKTQIRYMRWLLDRFDNNWEEAWIAYNWGIGNLKKIQKEYPQSWRSEVPDEPRNYVIKIQQYYNEYVERSKLVI